MKQKFKRTVAALLSAVMVLTSVNMVFADEAEGTDVTTLVEETVEPEDEALSGSAVSEDNAVIDMYSMLPLKEVECALDLKASDIEDYSAVLVSDVIANLQYTDESYVQQSDDAISDDDVIIWSYYKDDEGNQLTDKYTVVERTETVDLTPPTDAEDFTIEIIAGSSEDPLDSDNVRYIVRVYTSDEKAVPMSFEIYNQQGSTRTEENAEFSQTSNPRDFANFLGNNNILGGSDEATWTVNQYYLNAFGTDYYYNFGDMNDYDLYLGFNCDTTIRPGLEVRIYEWSEENPTPFYANTISWGDVEFRDGETNPGEGYS